MSYVPNSFTGLLALSAILNPSQMLETRIENDGDGNPIYVGVTPVANAATDEAVYWIIKLEYDAGATVRIRIPDASATSKGFIYEWDDRATLFS